MTYLFLGQDNFSKAIQLKKIKQEYLTKGCEQFNFDILYAKELALHLLQERLLTLPVKGLKRIVVVKDAQNLSSKLQEFIIKYVKAPYKKVILILDMEQKDRIEKFLNRIYRYVKIIRFKERQEPNTFTLSRWIEMKRLDYALRLLNHLLKKGERPERILGGLRYAWEARLAPNVESKRRFRLLLDCDRDIKTGRLKAHFALEKLIISLCFIG